MEEIQLSKEEVGIWKLDPTTKKIQKSIAYMVEDLKNWLVEGVEDPEYTRGFIQGLRLLLQIEGVDGNEEEE